MTETHMPPLDHGLVRRLQGQVADAMSAAKQARAAAGEGPLPAADERQFAQSVAVTVVGRYMQSPAGRPPTRCAR